MKLVLSLSLVLALSLPAAAQTNAHINHVAVFVVNLQRSMDFYSGIFQLDTIPEPFHDGRHAWYHIGPGIALHVIQGAPTEKEYYQNNHFCFSVNSVPTLVEKLKTQHIGWVNAQGEKYKMTNRVDGVHQIWLQDPDGYWIEVNDAKE